MKRITSGDLRHHITIMQWREDQLDEHGQPQGQWVPSGNVWAMIEPVQGRQVEYARQLYNQTTHTITIRFRPDLTINDRIVWSSSVYAIGFIANLEERNTWLRLLVSEVQDA